MSLLTLLRQDEKTAPKVAESLQDAVQAIGGAPANPADNRQKLKDCGQE